MIHTVTRAGPGAAACDRPTPATRPGRRDLIRGRSRVKGAADVTKLLRRAPPLTASLRDFMLVRREDGPSLMVHAWRMFARPVGDGQCPGSRPGGGPPCAEGASAKSGRPSLTGAAGARPSSPAAPRSGWRRLAPSP